MHREHERGKHVTLQLLHLEYKAAHPEGLSYTQVLRCSASSWLYRRIMELRA